MQTTYKFYRLMLCALLFLKVTSSFAQYNEEIAAEILIKSNSDFIEFKAKAYNKTNIVTSVRYVFTTVKKSINPDGSDSKNDQSGELVLSSGESKILSTVQLSANNADKKIVLLLIYNQEGKLIGKDRWSNLDDQGAVVTIQKEDFVKNVENQYVRGIITEQTKTKPGRDFFDFFYSEFTVRQIEMEESISVVETFAQGRTTLLQVMVGQRVVSQFFARPGIDFLKSMADFSIKKIEHYILSIKQQQQQISGY